MLIIVGNLHKEISANFFLKKIQSELKSSYATKNTFLIIFLDLLRFGSVEKTAVTVSASNICFCWSTIPNQSLSAVSRQRFLKHLNFF